MANPNRFPSGISTNNTRTTMNSFPAVPTPAQATFVQSFMPYQTDHWTVTQTGGTAANFAANGGLVKIQAGASASDVINLQLAQQGAQFIPGNQLWYSVRFTPAGSSAGDIFFGLADGTEYASGTLQNGAYFHIPNGGTAVNFEVVNGGTLTTFQNIADVQYPSAVYGNADLSTAGTITTAGSGGAYTSVAIGTAGSGYTVAPLVLTTGSVGSGATVYCQLGSGTLYSPILTAAGSSYTTYTNSVNAFVQFDMYYNGKGTLYVGVNNRTVMTIGLNGALGSTSNSIAVTAGNTKNVATSSSPNFFVSGTQVSSSIMPVQPPTGDAINLLPLNTLNPGMEITNVIASNTTAQTMYVDVFNFGVERN